MAEVIVLRTNYYDNTLDKMVRGLKAQTSRRVIAVVDSRTGPIEVPDDISKIVLDPVALGLYAHPEYGWRCGDYALYAALQAVPDISDFVADRTGRAYSFEQYKSLFRWNGGNERR